MLLALDRVSRVPVGLVALFEVRGEEPRPDVVDVRLGYVLAEGWWGRGLATELVLGLVEWCRSQSAIRSITAGVAEGNAASERVLVKAGFQFAGLTHLGERLYEVVLRPSGGR